MKRHGKLLSLILAVMLSAFMLLSASGLEIFIIASSDEYLGYGTSASYLETIGVMQGYDDGELHLEEPILRYQAALFFARVVTGVTNDTAWGTGASSHYTDVPEYGPVIDMITEMDIIRGYDNDTYGYNDGIRYQDMCALVVRVLGYETEEMIASYPLSYVFKIKELGLDLDGVKPEDYLNRGQTAQMVYDALVTEIADTTDKDVLALQKIIEAKYGADAVNETKETYLERNFDVSSTMYFEICATENYRMDADYEYAEEGYVNAYALTWNETDKEWDVGDIWSFPIEGTETADVSEADLIGKCLVVVFDEKTPTAEELDDEDISIIHADIVEATTYENMGELSYVKFNDDYTKLTLGTKTIVIEDSVAIIWQYSDDKSAVCDDMSFADLAEAIEDNTYFAIDYYDYNRDGNCDTLVYKPYSFGQYAERTYSGTKYVMVGQYRDAAVYDLTKTSDKTDDNKTNFVEYFLGQDTTAAATASKSYTKYTPGDTSLKINSTVGELSATVAVSGDDISTGDFMIYYYNPLLNELVVAENLGTYQLGTLTGYKGSKQVYVLDGSEISVGLPGNMTDDNGLLVGDGAYTATYNLARVIVSNYEKGNPNAKYLEYDGKMIYLDSYGGTDVVIGSDWVIIDIEETLDDYLDTLDDEDDAWDVPFDGNVALLKKVDAATGAFAEIQVEEVVVREGEEDVSYTFKNIAERHEIGSWGDMTLYNLIAANGVLYAIEDDDEDGKYELYAYGTGDFNVLGAKAIAPNEDGKATVSFSYNKSNEFVAENYVGILTDRVTTSASTVSIIIGQDGYRLVKGELGTDSTSKPNALWLTDAALILEATDAQLTIFDPAGFVVLDAEENQLYANNAASIWNTGNNSDDDVVYYMMLQNTVYGESYVMENADGSPAENDNGDILYAHEYRNLYNLGTGSSETVTLITTSLDAPATEVVNSVNGVIRYDAENNEATLTNFGEVFVENGDYRYGGFAWLAAKDRISFATQAKDEDGNGYISSDEKGQSFYANTESDLVYNTLSSLNVTFIDLDEGASVDSDEYSFTDAYVFYQDNESNRKYYAAVELEDREEGVDYPAGTFPVKRHVISAKDVSGNIANGKITALTAGKEGLIASPAFYRWNGWCDYLIPAVNEDGDTVWAYEGSLRVNVTYYAYIDYDEDANTCNAVVVRVGKIAGVVGANADVPDVADEPTDPSYNFTGE
ncbi:MAG: hypothetical protein IJ002_02325 [Clostridia bacterium]|nr:hypothetical protein [Clostridia bacterium]